ncbi:TetR/AcrR family transcriptional regulator [Desulfogranum japonicum]|uniref:TetR/AcrR family transcriptional regulator n=1 Tax=Desulfogranum japonicum TaxID=231447 RepID=UPI00041C3081|nr:TetR/AcrR family transcriptional regulator [Desulfogranum japonicum]
MRVRTEERRKSILETAEQIFLEMGYERASMSEISTQAGCSKPTLYGYFPSKAELLVEVIINRLCSDVVPAFMELENKTRDDPENVLTKLGEYYISMIASPEACAFKRLIAATMNDEADARQFWELGNKQAVSMINNYLAAATEAGYLQVEYCWTAAQQLLALYEAEVNWGGPIGVAPDFSAEKVRQASRSAVQVFLAAYKAGD